MNLIILPKSKDLLDTAFRRARKRASMLKSQRNRIKDAKGKNITRIEVSANYVSKTLQTAIVDFPSMNKVNAFYKELIESTVDLDATLKALGHMTAERRIIAKLRKRHIGKVKELGKEEAGNAAGIAKEFYGRLSHLVKKLDSSIEKYNRAAKTLKELPSIKFDLPTVIIAGCPNTGKSTLLGKLTKSDPKIASYPFTTQKLQIGYLEHNYSKIQLIDTPGLLDRPLSKRNSIERKAIAALRHLSSIIGFVGDPTMSCGFPIAQQAGLLEEIRKEFKEAKTIVVVNKADIASREEMEKAKKAFGKTLIEGKGIESGLKEEIAKLLVKEGIDK